MARCRHIALSDTSRKRAVATILTVAAGAGLVLASLSRMGTAATAPPARSTKAVTSSADSSEPLDYGDALMSAWQEVDDLRALATRKGMIPEFGKKAEQVMRKALEKSGATGADRVSLEKAIDSPLKVTFKQQLTTLRARCLDLYDQEMEARPNPYEAWRAAEQAFLRGAAELQRPGSNWDFKEEHQDLLMALRESQTKDTQLVEEQVKQGSGKQVIIEVIRKLQQQHAATQREAETRGAFPWKVKWQYFLETSPFGFRGQYSQGRSIVELLLIPSLDPRQKHNWINRIGQLNLAVAFDMLL